MHPARDLRRLTVERRSNTVIEVYVRNMHQKLEEGGGERRIIHALLDVPEPGANGHLLLR